MGRPTTIAQCRLQSLGLLLVPCRVERRKVAGVLPRSICPTVGYLIATCPYTQTDIMRYV